MKSVKDFIDVPTSDEVIILGQCPSTKTKPFSNGTFARLKRWCDTVNLTEWDFHNVIPNKINSHDMKDVDIFALHDAVYNKKLVIALGGFVSKVCTKYNIEHYKIDHPSPRNRNLNDPQYEKQMLKKLKAHLNEYRNNSVLR